MFTKRDKGESADEFRERIRKEARKESPAGRELRELVQRADDEDADNWQEQQRRSGNIITYGTGYVELWVVPADLEVLSLPTKAPPP
jgi:hypothetical protein